MDGSTDKIRTVAATAAFRWIWDALNIGRRGAGAIFGGAGLLLLAALGAMLALMFGLAGLFAAMHQPSPWVTMPLGIAIMLVMLLGMALCLVGYLRLIDAVESGRSAGATDAFGGFGDFVAGSRAFAILLLVMLFQQAMMVAAVAWFLPDLGRWYLDVLGGMGAAAGTPPPALPTSFWKLYPASVLLNMLGSWVQAVAIGQVALGGRNLAGALRDGIASLARNLPALLMLLVAGVTFAVGIVLVVLLAVFAVVLVAKLVAMWLAVVLAIVLYLAFLIAMIAVGCASMYYMWRDIAGPGATPSPAAVEA
jgi:hypothetical protein